jgi:hypothetical protein
MPAPVSHMIDEKFIQNFGQKSEERSHGRHRHREDNIIMDLKKTG